MPTSQGSDPRPLASLGYELRFEQLTRAGRARTFPCDAEGTLAIGTMSTRLQSSYHDAMARVGHDFAYPCIVPSLVTRSVAH